MNREPDWQSCEHVLGIGGVEEADGGPARVEKQARGVGSCLERYKWVILAMHDGQWHVPLLSLEFQIVVGGRLALEDHPGGDRKRPGDQFGAVHEKAVGEKTPL